jgi:hypothetical protein
MDAKLLVDKIEFGLAKKLHGRSFRNLVSKTPVVGY